MLHISHRMRSPDPKERAEAINWIKEAYRRLGSIEAVAAEAGVHVRTCHRYIDAHPELGKALAKAGHVFGAGNVARRVEAGEARAVELLSELKDRSCSDVGQVAAMLDVTPMTVMRWIRVYPSTAAIVARKIRS